MIGVSAVEDLATPDAGFLRLTPVQRRDIPGLRFGERVRDCPGELIPVETLVAILIADNQLRSRVPRQHYGATLAISATAMPYSDCEGRKRSSVDSREASRLDAISERNRPSSIDSAPARSAPRI